MKNFYTWKALAVLSLFYFSAYSSLFGQVSLTASAGTLTGTFTSVSDAFAAINAGTHQGTIVISINGNTTEPAAPNALLASGQGTTLFTSLTIKPTVVATISGATSPGSGVLNFDGADNIVIDGSITPSGLTRDLTISNTAAVTVANVAVIRLIGRTTGGLGVDGFELKNCIVSGSTPGNNGSSGTTVNTTFGLYAGSNVATTMSAFTAGANYDNITIENNQFVKSYYGVHIYGGVAPNQADNVIVRNNEFGSNVVADYLGFRGINVYHVVNALIENNTVKNIKVTSNVSCGGIEVGGTASTNARVTRNRIEGIYSESTSGYGAYGINITGGTNHVIDNNVITDIKTVNYSATSQLFNAFGIRLTSGTGHKIYYNSVNLFGNYTLGTAAASAAAFVVTATSVQGIDVKNNIFNNSITSNSANAKEFHAVWFPTSYNFANATLNNNYYGVPNDTEHFVGKVGITASTGNFSTLANWQAISQVGNVTNDNTSFPINNSVAPFTSNLDLTIPAGTVTAIESAGTPIASLGLPNTDFLLVNRPGSPGIAPDLGAYEFAGFLITCPQPTNLSLVISTTNSASIQWTVVGSETSWQTQHGPVGFTLGSGTSNVTGDNPTTINGLASNQFYHVYVRGICGAGDTSQWTGPLTINTFGFGQYMESDVACGPGFTNISNTGSLLVLASDDESPVILPFPFYYQGTLVTEATIGNNGGLVLNTTTAQLALTNTVLTSAANGLYPFWDNLMTTGPGVWTETIGTAPNRIFIAQWNKDASGSAGNPVNFQLQIHESNMQIYFLYDDVITGSATTNFGASATIGVAGPSQDIQLSFNNANFLTNNSCARFYYTDCPKPINLTFTAISQEEAIVNWAAGLSSETEWTLEYGPTGFTPGSAQGTVLPNLALTSQLLPNLTPVTTYDVYIYANCASGDTSNALFGSFTTLPNCATPTAVAATADIDSLFVTWNYTQTISTIDYFNLQYGTTGFNLYNGTTVQGTLSNNADTLVNADFMAGVSYQVYVQSVCTNGDTSIFAGPFTITMPLTNDTVCYAEMLNVDGTLYNFIGNGATVDNFSVPNEASIAPPLTGLQTTTGWGNTSITRSTWFTFVAPTTGQVRIDATDNGFDGQMAVYEVGNCDDFATFTLLAANDNAIGGGSLAPNFTVCGLTPGNTYYLMHDPFSTTVSIFTYSIKITPISLEAGNVEPLTNMCYGDTLDLFQTINGNETGGFWIPTNGNIGLVQDSLFASTGLAYTTFDFQYRVVDGCAYDSIVSQVKIFPPSSAGEDGGMTVCRNEPINLLAGLGGLVEAGGTWYDPSNNPLPNGAISASNFPGNYNYDYIVGNGVCPDDTALVIVNVDPSCNYWDWLSTEEFELEQMTVYPNPSEGTVFVSNTSSTTAYNYEIMDMNGRIIATVTNGITGSSVTEINLNEVESGIYLIRLFNQNASKTVRISIK